MLDRPSLPRLYVEFSEWWPLLSRAEDYAEEAAFFAQVLLDACDPPPQTILELGCGGGCNASHLKTQFRLTLTDLSPGMLDASRRLNPECEHLSGDMRMLRLGRTFDAVFVHDAVVYMACEEDLQRAFETASVHLRPGGCALFVPDWVRETFAPKTSHGGHDGEGRALRYLEWIHDPEPDDTTYCMDFAYLFLEQDGAVHTAHDRHICGLFPRETWLRLLRETGFTPRMVVDPYGREVFVALR